MNEPVRIVGAGLAGCTLAWQCAFRGIPFQLIETSPQQAGSLAAAGMVSPVTGKAFNPSWRLEEFYDSAQEFYAEVEKHLRVKLWYDYSVTRLFFSAKDKRKFFKKREENPALDLWVDEVLDSVPHALAEHGAVVWKGSGRLDVKTLVIKTREHFKDAMVSAAGENGLKIFTTGARGLVEGNPLTLPHRSAKGEILMVKVPKLSQENILSRGTWIVPTGKGDETFLAGANYEWDDLTNTPTPEGRQTVEEGIKSLISLPYEVVGHTAGVRPIVRRSEPVIGQVKPGEFLLNGLGSKGVLYAPKAAETLLSHIYDGAEIPEELALSGVMS